MLILVFFFLYFFGFRFCFHLLQRLPDQSSVSRFRHWAQCPGSRCLHREEGFRSWARAWLLGHGYSSFPWIDSTNYACRWSRRQREFPYQFVSHCVFWLRFGTVDSIVCYVCRRNVICCVGLSRRVNLLNKIASMRSRCSRMALGTSSFGRHGKRRLTKRCARGWMTSMGRLSPRTGFFTCRTKGIFASWRHQLHADFVANEDG